MKIGKNETVRLERLKLYDILDTPPDGSFDKITSLASKMFNVPIVLITLVDKDRIWFKSHHGLDTNEIGRDDGLCSSAILGKEVYYVENAIEDPRCLANPLVAGEFGLRFYAAAPLQTKDGYNLGTICLIDRAQRYLNKDQLEMLQDLARIVMDQMEVRLEARIQARKNNDKISELEKEILNRGLS